MWYEIPFRCIYPNCSKCSLHIVDMNMRFYCVNDLLEEKTRLTTRLNDINELLEKHKTKKQRGNNNENA